MKREDVLSLPLALPEDKDEPEGRPLEDAAREFPELRVALETWVDPFGKGLGV